MHHALAHPRARIDPLDSHVVPPSGFAAIAPPGPERMKAARRGAGKAEVAPPAVHPQADAPARLAAIRSGVSFARFSANLRADRVPPGRGAWPWPDRQQQGKKGETMAENGWSIEGQYMETCNCAFICPCITSNLADMPTEGDCKAAIAMKIDKGQKDGVSLDGLAFIVMLHAPGAMIDGNIKVGLIVDDRADDAQTEAISAIATGAVGGPMSHLAPLVGEVAGVEKAAISFTGQGMTYAVKAGSLVDQEIAGVPSMADETVPVTLDNTGHPANARLALAKATRSIFNVFGITWNDTTGSRNGHFAPFAWSA